MIRTPLTAILELTDDQKLQIIKEFEQFEKEGFIDSCLLREIAMTMIFGSNHTTKYMNDIAMECYRYFANKWIKGE